MPLVKGRNYRNLDQLRKRFLATGGLKCMLQARLRRALHREAEEANKEETSRRRPQGGVGEAVAAYERP